MKIIIVGKSASGKDFLKNALQQRGAKLDVSYTTRPIRDHEKEGVDINTVSDDQFDTMINDDQMLQWQEFNGKRYGTSMESWNSNDVFIMNVSGLEQLKDVHRKQALVIYINPDSETRFDRVIKRDYNTDVDELEKRFNEGDEEAARISKEVADRVEADDKEYAEFKNYDIEIIDADYINVNMFNVGS